MPSQLTAVATHAGSPAATRAVPVRIDSFKNRIAYGSGNTVIVRSVLSEEDVFVCSLHNAAVTAVRFSPSGTRVASGDAKGNLILWQNKPGTHELYRATVLQGAVRDIAWTGDDERLVVVGEGRNVLGVAITNTGNSIGEINGHAGTIVTCDMRAERPFRAVTGGSDSLVAFYEGVPFKLKHTVPGHQNNVTCARYSPDLACIATCSSLAEVILLDGKTGEKTGSIATPHKGTVFALAWSRDGKRLATASADKSVCILDVAAQQVLHHISLGTAVSDMQQGIACTDDGIVTVSLGGHVRVIDEANGQVVRAYQGHQSRVKFLCVNPTDGALLSVSVDGRVLLAPKESPGSPRLLPLPDTIANCATFANDTLFVVCGKSVVSFAAASQYAAATVSEEGGNHASAIAVTGDGHIFLLQKTKAVVLSPDGGRPCGAAEELGKFDPLCAASQGQTVIVGGNNGARLFSVSGAGLTADKALEGQHSTGVSAVALSADGSRAATGDSSRNIVVWSTADGSVLFQHLTFHTLAVSSLCFSPSGKQLLSGSADCSIIVWDLDGETRKIQDSCHRGGVSAVCWGPDDTLYSTGSDFCICLWRQ